MRMRAAVCGATGLVGQRIIKHLEEHPDFELTLLLASQRSAGKRYASALRYKEAEFLPETLEMRVENLSEVLDREGDIGVDLFFSALPSKEAKIFEEKMARKAPVFSNSSAYRLDPQVPCIIGEVNPDHLELIKLQRGRGWKGYIVASPNCTTTGLALPLKPIHDRYGIREVIVSTMQALSGAGEKGVDPASEYRRRAEANVLPYIEGEEEKVEAETLKILGRYERGIIREAGFKVNVSCHRVPVLHGHMEAVFIKTYKECDPEDVKETLRRFRGLPQELGLRTAPKEPILVLEEEDRPQPKMDVDEGGGMSVVVGRVRGDEDRAIKFILLSHNLERGAAGETVLHAELCKHLGYL